MRALHSGAMAAAGAIVITNKPINTNATTPSPADVTQWNIAMRFLRPRPTSVDAGTPAGGESRADRGDDAPHGP